jgi:hypothetical protein
MKIQTIKIMKIKAIKIMKIIKKAAKYKIDKKIIKFLIILNFMSSSNI